MNSQFELDQERNVLSVNLSPNPERVQFDSHLAAEMHCGALWAALKIAAAEIQSMQDTITDHERNISTLTKIIRSTQKENLRLSQDNSKLRRMIKAMTDAGVASPEEAPVQPIEPKTETESIMEKVERGLQ